MTGPEGWPRRLDPDQPAPADLMDTLTNDDEEDDDRP